MKSLPEELEYINNQPILEKDLSFFYDGDYRYHIETEDQFRNIRLKALQLGVTDKVKFEGKDCTITLNEYGNPNENHGHLFLDTYKIMTNLFTLQRDKRNEKRNI